MKSLEPPNSHHLLAASGWLDLGNYMEANKELENISEEFRTHPDVLELRWQICAKESKWEACVDIARTMTALAPSRPDGWLHLAYALRRAPGGGLEAAWNTLLPAAEKFPKEIIIPFNLACYAAQLKRLDSAREWLKKAFALARKADCLDRIKAMALNEPDLEPVRSDISKI